MVAKHSQTKSWKNFYKKVINKNMTQIDTFHCYSIGKTKSDRAIKKATIHTVYIEINYCFTCRKELLCLISYVLHIAYVYSDSQPIALHSPGIWWLNCWWSFPVSNLLSSTYHQLKIAYNFTVYDIKKKLDLFITNGVSTDTFINIRKKTTRRQSWPQPGRANHQREALAGSWGQWRRRWT